MRKLTYKSILVAAILLCASIARAQSQAPLPSTSCTACNEIVLRGTGGVQQPTTGKTLIYGIAATWSIPAAVRAIEIFDQGTVPANGPVSPAYCYVVNGTAGPALGSVTLDWTVHPLQTLTGCVIVVSTNAAGCTNLTLDTPSNRLDIQAQSP